MLAFSKDKTAKVIKPTDNKVELSNFYSDTETSGIRYSVAVVGLHDSGKAEHIVKIIGEPEEVTTKQEETDSQLPTENLGHWIFREKQIRNVDDTMWFSSATTELVYNYGSVHAKYIEIYDSANFDFSFEEPPKEIFLDITQVVLRGNITLATPHQGSTNRYHGASGSLYAWAEVAGTNVFSAKQDKENGDQYFLVYGPDATYSKDGEVRLFVSPVFTFTPLSEKLIYASESPELKITIVCQMESDLCGIYFDYFYDWVAD